jgi:hypothetical protein
MHVAEVAAAAKATASSVTAAASHHTPKSSLAQQEAWMINLGRGDNDQWLTGPRDEDEWFTGLKPSLCPGVQVNSSNDASRKYHLRSLPLPRLDNVTRHNARQYFDNSWTLYETLFAGLNGEGYFYR